MREGEKNGSEYISVLNLNKLHHAMKAFTLKLGLDFQSKWHSKSACTSLKQDVWYYCKCYRLCTPNRNIRESDWRKQREFLLLNWSWSIMWLFTHVAEMEHTAGADVIKELGAHANRDFLRPIPPGAHGTAQAICSI